MIADTSDLHALSSSQLRHADDLCETAAELVAARVDADAFGSVGADFLVALNRALAHAAAGVESIAERLHTARATAAAAAVDYHDAEGTVGQSILRTRT